MAEYEFFQSIPKFENPHQIRESIRLFADKKYFGYVLRALLD